MKISLKNLQNFPIFFKAKETKKGKKNLQLTKHWICHTIAKFQTYAILKRYNIKPLKIQQWMYKKGLLSKCKVPLAHWSISNNLSFNCIMTTSALSTLLSIRKLFCFILFLVCHLACFVLFEEVRVSARMGLKGKVIGQFTNIMFCALGCRVETICGSDLIFSLPSTFFSSFILLVWKQILLIKSQMVSSKFFLSLLSAVPSSSPSLGSAWIYRTSVSRQGQDQMSH